MLFGGHLDLHPIIILLSLAFWSILWGVTGMILSVPLIAIARIACQHLEHPYARYVCRTKSLGPHCIPHQVTP
jgi:predicted PurR-regulated permease PerM